MKSFIHIFLTVAVLGLVTSCENYLDIVPNNIATLNDAFKTESAAKNFHFSLYSYQPQEAHVDYSLTLWGTDELAVPTSWLKAQTAVMQGKLNSSNPYFNYWGSGSNTGSVPLYDGIRQCYIFLNNIDKSPVSNAEKGYMKAEATFLIGYYHFLLLRHYGPICLVDKEIDFTSDAEFFPKRSTYDQCVNFIAGKFDEAEPGLMKTSSDVEYGRITSAICKAIKARLYLYAASPLYNGNAEFYSDFKNSDGELLMPLVYDNSKWQRAADAILSAIQAAESIGFKLYDGKTTAKENCLYSIVDPMSMETLWGETRFHVGWQTCSSPRTDQTWAANGVNLDFVEAFYSKNGLPIDVDPDYIPKNAWYTLDADTLKLHQNREPRFYASIGYDRGKFLWNNRVDLIKIRFGESTGYNAGNGSKTGYIVQKGVHPQTMLTNSEYAPIQYSWPKVRMADLYLMYAEALNEAQGESAQSTVIEYLDKIRTRSGIPSVQTAWAKVGKTQFTKSEMTDIIRQERMIELAFEGQRYWDIKRWKLANAYFNKPIRGWDVEKSTATEFYQPKVAETRVFTSPRDYLMPISIAELGKNTNLVQNPGW